VTGGMPLMAPCRRGTARASSMPGPCLPKCCPTCSGQRAR
jgi:hypothetical protein